ncbi:MAG: hypothetical protein DWH81_08255 [Planctomycetota bacterium]|nr:MAG: hypothetical protein DWH81_08255 [Planctomycetota bacterium]
MPDDKSLASGPQLQPYGVQMIFHDNHLAHRRTTEKTGDSAEPGRHESRSPALRAFGLSYWSRLPDWIRKAYCQAGSSPHCQ